MGSNYHDDAYCAAQNSYIRSDDLYGKLLTRLSELEATHPNPDSILELRHAIESYYASLAPYIQANCDLGDYQRYFPGFWGSGSSAAQASCIAEQTKNTLKY